MKLKPHTYYGNDSETYFVNDVLTIFCIQSPDLLIDVFPYTKVGSMPASVAELDSWLIPTEWPDYITDLAGVLPLEVANV